MSFTVMEEIDLLSQNNASLRRAIERSNELAEWCARLGGTPQNQGQFIALMEYTIDLNHKRIMDIRKSMGD